MSTYAPKSCSESCAYTPCSPYDFRYTSQPGCANVQGVMNLTNYANTPFSHKGYLQARTECRNIYSPWRKTLDYTDAFPVWPFRQSKIYPTMDYTNNAFPLTPEPAPENQLNTMHNEVSGWNPTPHCLGANSHRRRGH